MSYLNPGCGAVPGRVPDAADYAASEPGAQEDRQHLDHQGPQGHICRSAAGWPSTSSGGLSMTAACWKACS
jgi:hypothetical protein